MSSLRVLQPGRRFYYVIMFIFALSFICALPLYGEPEQLSTSSNDPVIATFNNGVIKKSEFYQAIQDFKKKTGKQDVSIEERKRLVNNLIIRHLILRHPSAQEIKSEKNFIRAIKAYENATIIKFFLEKEIGRKMIATDEEIRKFYDANPDRFKTSKKASTLVILLRNREEAELVKKKIESGEDFSALVAHYSVDLSTVKNGGKLLVEDGKVLPVIGKAVFSLKENEISPILETNYGYSIFKVEKIIPAETKSFEAARDEVKTQILKQKEAEAFLQMEERLKKGAEIKISEKLL
ncbi:peptidyl-prolyl cis-trans isomerase [uncultured Desulfobacter sp.]|uniref:peptidylprolyl isomerase n=1 Tax=uncultured Desulfobacter sp. TaxID=240139 RepID=UPI002AA6820F|nr:peptidyl-prolyl cis-trans isomerase [uncultured Desulfobacter sp.]